MINILNNSLKYIFLYTLLIFIGCSKKTNTPLSLEVNLKDTISIPASDWFSSIDIIPLETSEHSLLYECTKIEFFNDRYYIFDFRQHAVFVFDITGKFLFNTLSSKGRGPKEYISMTDIAMNRTTGNLEILDAYAHRIVIFDKDGLYIKDIKLPEDLLPLGQFQSLSKDIYLFYSASSDENRECIYVFDAQRQKVIKKMFMLYSYENDIVKTRMNPFFWMDTIMAFSHTLPNNDIYQIDTNLNIKKLFSYNFGNNTFDASTLPKNENPSFYRSFVSTHIGKYVFPFEIFENTKYYFCFFLFNNAFYIARHQKTSDYRYFTGEVINARFNDGGMIHLPILFDNNYLYNIIEPSWLPFMVNKTLLTDRQKEMLHAIPDDNNPIILKYKLR